MRNIPIYDKTAEYAIEHNEIAEYKASNKANIACKEAVTEAINKNYRDYICDTDTALKELRKDFSLERIAVVTAVTIRPKDWDLRYSQKNKEWAKSFPFPDNIDEWGRNRNVNFSITQVHPGLVNLFADSVRKELDLEKTAPPKKPSLLEKLNKPLPDKKSAETKADRLEER
ncbi:MAG: DUF3849 domain-containing protein [Oscillospiraceae bacterium]|nr:DUF3849 domain-containing protein [Oscillospiraceae bacterium]